MFSKHEHLPKWAYALHTILYLTFLNLTIYLHDISMSVHLDQLHSIWKKYCPFKGGVQLEGGAPPPASEQRDRKCTSSRNAYERISSMYENILQRSWKSLSFISWPEKSPWRLPGKGNFELVLQALTTNWHLPWVLAIYVYRIKSSAAATADLRHSLKGTQGGQQKWGTLYWQVGSWGEACRTGLQTVSGVNLWAQFLYPFILRKALKSFMVMSVPRD